jgi:trehalose-phosphatase
LRDSVINTPHEFDTATAVADAVAHRVGGRHLLLLTDYDGTLAELAPTPAEAVLTEAAREALRKVAALDRITLGVVSGRRLSDVTERVGPAPAYAAGLHGLEIEGRSAAFRHFALNTARPIIDKVGAEAAVHLAWCPGVLLENKTYALTCHVRLVPDELAESALGTFEAIAEPYLEVGTLRMLIGARAMELLPAADWHKGRAVDWIRRQVSRRVGQTVPVVYLGDDRTDEDAFTALTDDDFGIGVGLRPHSHMIDGRLSGPAAVGEFLELVAKLLTR